MIFDDNFIEQLEEDPLNSLILACSMTQNASQGIATQDQHEKLWEGATFIDMALDANNIDVAASLPVQSLNVSDNIQQLSVYLNAVTNELKHRQLSNKIDSYQKEYKPKLRNLFAYEFSDGDLERVQALVNELRDHISTAEGLDDAHRQRLLARLEKLQSELHKRVSDLDRFWGMVGDAGVVMGKLGNDAKPIVDRIRELAQITWKTQSRSEELPSGLENPMIEHDGAS